MVPTLLGVLAVSFIIIQFAPGGPVERMIAKISGFDQSATQTISGNDESAQNQNFDASSEYRGARGIDPKYIKQLEEEYGFDKPAHERFVLMVWNFARFDFGESFYADRPVVEIIKEKLPVSISLGLWSTLIAYLISIPLGIAKAVRDGTRFDTWTSVLVIVGYAVPGFLFAVLLIILFASGTYFDWFPLKGLTSEGWEEFSLFHKIIDYFWHLVLPLAALVISAFATTTLLTKNAFMDEIGRQYVVTARAKGLSEKQVLYGHVFRNAMLVLLAGFPAAFMAAFFTGSILIETIFSLDGLGLLSFNAIVDRDYPIVFANLFIFSLIAMVVTLIADLAYMFVDPRIDFEGRAV